MGGDEDIMELLWHNGQVVAQSQNQRSVGNRKPTAGREIRSSVVEEETTPSDLFMQEDEMSSWLHYPLDDNSLDRYLYSNDLLYPTPPPSAPVTTAPSSLPPPPPPTPPSVMVPSPRPPVPPFRRVEEEPAQTRYTNFLHFSRPNKGRTHESTPSSSSKMSPVVKQSTVESNETPVAEAPESRASRVSDTRALVSAANIGFAGSTSGVGAAGTSSAGREPETCDLSVSSSAGTGGLGASASAETTSQNPPPATDDQKRKGRDTDDTECRREDIEFEYADTKKQSHGSTSTKRSRAAEVHNLSERRRRDRINEKMKALQELIPRCNKSDKASMLDEAIEYLKSLQLQVQMMSMGCSMVPMMFPGVQQYMPQTAMGMGMGVDRSMVPYPTIFPGPNPAAAHLGQRFPVPGFNTAPAASQAANMSAPMMSSFPLHIPNQRVPNFIDQYQQYLGLHQTQIPLPQNQTGMPPIASKPSSNKDVTNPDHHQIG